MTDSWWCWLEPLRGEVAAQTRDGGMNEKPHVGHRELGDPRDFLVAKTILKLQPHHLLLIRRQLPDHLQKFLVRLLRFERAPRTGVSRGDAFHFPVFEPLHATILAQNIERAVSA